MKTKICNHCGAITHPQPQDPNHDTNYGHCYSCLNNHSWYVASHDQLAPNIQLYIWQARNYTNGPLTSDDSHAKVIELVVCNKVEVHLTTYKTIQAIRDWAEIKVKTFNASVSL